MPYNDKTRSSLYSRAFDKCGNYRPGTRTRIANPGESCSRNEKADINNKIKNRERG
jgi:hypothetical protein